MMKSIRKTKTGKNYWNSIRILLLTIMVIALALSISGAIIFWDFFHADEIARTKLEELEDAAYSKDSLKYLECILPNSGYSENVKDMGCNGFFELFNRRI